MTAMLAGAGPLLRTLPTGETRRHDRYILPIIEDLVRQGLLVERPEPRWSLSPARPLYRVAPGVRLRRRRIELGYAGEAAEALATFRRARAEHGLPGLRLQIGMATDFTFTTVALAARARRRHRKAFAATMHREIAAIRELAGDDVVIQLEAPAELILTTKTWHWHRFVDRALRFGRGMGALAAASPEGTRFGVHLCLGGMNNKAGATMDTAKPLVYLANSVVRHWPEGRILDYVHGPIAAGDIPPPRDPAFYAPLAGLALDEGTRFYAGFVHETPSAAEQIETLGMIEDALGRRLDGVASACGLGSRTRDVADLLVTRAAELAVAESIHRS
ncbi:hypothetical protein VMT65_02825 [Nocardia sp. CDC153]|uniref:hypothetical protein n=1 Tax=Nocardia sp. CDC153 TaxID=3112167 RepID=UPI002DB8CF18|nr:hypothetical protein [Nocardia sp. CDC153]MEC3951958.1 hypothetical protein [Nocardia sp. CDC153]